MYTLLFGGLMVWVARRRGGAPPGLMAGVVAVMIAASSSRGAASDPWHEVSVGGSTGRWVDCNGAHRHVGGGAAYKAYVPVSDELELTAGAQVGGGVYQRPSGAFDQGFGEGALLVGIEHRWVGAEVGAWLGGSTDTVMLPAARLRVGPRDVVWVVAQAFSARPYALPRPGAEVGVGFALPRLPDAWDHPRIEGGLSGSGFYVRPSVPLPGRVTLDAFGAYGDELTWQVAGGVRYAFGPRPTRPSLPPWK